MTSKPGESIGVSNKSNEVGQIPLVVWARPGRSPDNRRPASPPRDDSATMRHPIGWDTGLQRDIAVDGASAATIAKRWPRVMPGI